MKKFLYCFVYCSMVCILPGYSQSPLTYQSVIIDSITRKPLPNVRIYVDKDTVGMKNHLNGTFQLTNVKKGSIVRFKKTGYRWLNMEITDNPVKIIEMVPTTHSALHNQVDEIEVNGKPLPKEEWNDLNPAYFNSVSVLIMDNKKSKLVITTK
ncbi:MAG: carboxypeptidase-like regulatory domain-containing protein [Tannerella sp.]|nr:carboxypeptidase-like regulatory domain-containing protein [Tannerella sp.]